MRDIAITAARSRWSDALCLTAGLLQCFGMAFDWFAGNRGDQFTNPAWGDRFGEPWSLVTLGCILIGGLTILAVSERALKATGDDAAKWSRIYRAVRWVVFAWGLVGLAIATIAIVTSLREEWMIHPGWAGTWIAQVLMIAGTLMAPIVADEPRLVGMGNWRVQQGFKWTCVLGMATAAIGAIVFSIVVPRVPQAFQLVHDGGQAADGAQVTVQELPGREADGGGAGITAVDASGATVWEIRWRGVKTARLIPSGGGESVAVLLDQASPRRTRLALVDARDGSEVKAFDYAAAGELGLGLDGDVDTKDFFVHGETLVFDGGAEEWIGAGGVGKWIGPDAETKQRDLQINRRVNGLHGRMLVSDGRWFVGGGQLCGRETARQADDSWVSSGDVVVMVQACNKTEVDTGDPVYYVGPAGAEDTTEPGTAILLGVDATDGSAEWTAPLPLAQSWVDSHPDVRGVLEESKGPWTFALDGDEATMTMDGQSMTFDVDSGK